MCIGLMCNSLAALMMNPANIFPKDVRISILGFCLLNAFAGFTSISSIVDLSSTLKKLGFNEIISNDYASAFYMYAINVGDLIGPVLGGCLSNYIGFEYSSTIIGFTNLTYSLLFFVFNFKLIKGYLNLIRNVQKKKEH